MSAESVGGLAAAMADVLVPMGLTRQEAAAMTQQMLTTANAAAEVGAGGMYVSAQGDGSFTVTHANNAQADRTFDYTVTG